MLRSLREVRAVLRAVDSLEPNSCLLAAIVDGDGVAIVDTNDVGVEGLRYRPTALFEAISRVLFTPAPHLKPTTAIRSTLSAREMHSKSPPRLLRRAFWVAKPKSNVTMALAPFRLERISADTWHWVLPTKRFR